MASRSRILPTLVAALGVVAALAASAGAAGGYETDTGGCQFWPTGPSDLSERDR